jgi:phosphatidylserine/phosphatidylglycerophosphate/cardiolipin synthase-like enzyme
VWVQVTPTLPEPIAEQSILESWAKALANAEHFIYIEDQYFRMPLLDEVIAASMAAHPALTLIVVTKPVTPTDGGKKFTVQADRRYRDAYPDRYLLLQFKAFDAVPRPALPEPGDESAGFYFVDMDTHSKILIVDDVYLSVGSCNKNNRGVLYEGELNVAAYDSAWVRAQRERVYRNFLGPRLAAEVGDDPGSNFVLIRDTAAANAEVEAWWQANGPGLTADQVGQAALDHRPDGFAYPLTFTDDYALDVGPDAF